ncbi:MAG: hypothetical protein DRP01_05815 [Archaeoglobales archaeon]|nr:MAG: hypothetical protein DRP01_05815 [Archaeoglobales archaeon]
MQKKVKISLGIIAVACGLILLFTPLIYVHTNAWIKTWEDVGLNDKPWGVQNVYATVYDDQGNPVGHYETHNNLTIAGIRDFIRHRLFNSSASLGTAHYIAIGTGTDDGNVTNNEALVSELDRKAATEYIPGGAYNKYGLNATFTFTGSHTLKEAGVLTQSSGGILVFYVNDWNIGVDSSWTVQVSWQITINEG